MKAWYFLTKPRGDRRWDLFLRATGLAALVLIPIPLLFPSTAPLMWLAIVGIPANSPLSPILPTAFDPLIIEIGKYAPAFTVTCVATGVYMYTEFLNWHIYAWVLSWERLDGFRENRWGLADSRRRRSRPSSSLPQRRSPSALSIPTYLIIAVIVLGAMVAIGARVARGQAILEDVVIDRALKPSNPASPALSEDS